MFQMDAATALAHMAVHVEHRTIVDRLIPSIHMLSSGPFGDPLKAASALVELAQHVDFSVVIETVVAPLIEKLADSDPYIRMTSATMIARIAEDQKFWDTVNEIVPSFITLLGDTEGYVRSAAAAVFNTLTKRGELHENTLAAIDTVVPLLVEQLTYGSWIAFVGDKGAASALINLASHKFPGVRASAAAVIERWIKYPEIQSNILRIKEPGAWPELLNDADEMAIEPLARIFCHLVTNGWIYTGILSVILKALSALEGRNSFPNRWGAIMLLTMASDARLRDAMVEVFTIHSSIRHFIKDVSAEEADLLLLKMESFGILKEL
ncbi:hypothetical protein M408DRAFT_284484 [Serendipita vermifera MAFF 305830]|uniref:Condensin complex subunit 1 C-terminal domain-containing protein n=1 Tax=Serendipita vermifera MAFF 305830 TaxID=933852 RepID=A0A0C3AQZ2_SERVB|nr:hypothetical protein M408DRAFT_284484 [Serendipita vermifera MAFF 305830]